MPRVVGAPYAVLVAEQLFVSGCSRLISASFGIAKQKDVLCFAHLTNTMAQQEGDFEKGEDMGSTETLALIREVLDLLG